MIEKTDLVVSALIPILAMASLALGDTVQGTVTDAATGAPIYRVKVSADSNRFTYTDKAGGFLLNTESTTGVFAETPKLGRENDPMRSWDAQGRKATLARTMNTRLFQGTLPSLDREQPNGLIKGAATSAANVVRFEQAGFLPMEVTIAGSQSGMAVKMRIAPVDTTAGLHPFLYAGEWQNASFANQTMYIVKGGKIVWSYAMPAAGELGEATLLSNGNIVFCRKTGASEITQDKRIVWNIDAPAGTEIHAVKPIGLDRVLYVLQGKPAYLRIVNIKTGVIEKQMILPVGKPDSPHLQFRRVALTKAGTFLAAHLDNSKVAEYDSATGKEIWSVATGGPWCAVRLKNGNTLVSGNGANVREFNPQKQIVWEMTKTDFPAAYKLNIFQEVSRLENGNTIICNWVGNITPADKPGSVQVLEVTPEKRIVWAMKSWKDPNLNTASAIQLLDEPGIPENGDLQR